MDQTLLFYALLLIHVGGAIVGFGPTFAFPILGGMAAKAGPNGGLALLESIEAIEKKITIPIATTTQPLSGITLIFLGGYAASFFSHIWLVLGILAFATAYYVAVFVNTPLLGRIIAGMKAGPPTPEILRMGAQNARNGRIIAGLLVTIIFLMVVKPGG